jgi:hypothetical protein
MIEKEFTIYSFFTVIFKIELAFYFKKIGIVFFKCTFAKNLSF